MTHKTLSGRALVLFAISFFFMFALSYGTSFAQYNYSAPAAAPAPATNMNSTVNTALTPAASSPAPASTASDPGSVAPPAIPNTGKGGEAPGNILQLFASAVILLYGLKLVLGPRGRRA